LRKRKKYVRGMMKAIESARKPKACYVNNNFSKTDALRVIKRFEKVNKMQFDPYDKRQIACISGKARYESFFRNAK